MIGLNWDLRRSAGRALGRFGAMAACILLLTANVQTAPAGPAAPAGSRLDPAAAFGARESVESVRISPDGWHLAYVSPREGQGSTLYVVDLASGESVTAASADGIRQRLGGCAWVSNDRLICEIYAVQRFEDTIVTVTRLVAMDAAGGNVRQLGEPDSFYQRSVRLWGGDVIDWLPGENGAVLLGQSFVPEQRAAPRLE